MDRQRQTDTLYRQSEKLVKQQCLPTCPYNMVNFGPLAAKIVSLVWSTPTNVNCFASWQRYCTAL